MGYATTELESPGRSDTAAGVLALDPNRLSAAGLTDREIEVLGLTARGMINDAIGPALGISPRTVQKHLEHVHEKLGVGTRMAAVAKAYELTVAGPSPA